MSRLTRPLPTTIVIVLCALAALAVLALVPMIQMWFAYTFMDVEGLKAYISSQPVAFYQFVLTAFAVLAAIGGYLTYRSRQDAKAEGEEMCRTMGADFKKQADAEMRNKMQEFDAYADQLRKAMETELQRFSQAIGEHAERARKASDELATRVQKTGEEEEGRLRKAVADKISQVQGIQLPVPGESAADKEAREAFNEGVRLQLSGDPDKAIAKLREAIRLKPSYAEAHSSLGRVLADKGKWEEAFTELRLAIRLNPSDPQVHFRLGMALARKGNTHDAVLEFREVIALKADHAFAHCALGHALLGDADPAGAITESQEALRLQPDFELAIYTVACALAMQKNCHEAAENLRRAIDLDPDLLNMARTDPLFQSCRDAAEFIAILGEPPYDKPEAEAPGDSTGHESTPTGDLPKAAPDAQAAGTTDPPKP